MPGEPALPFGSRERRVSRSAKRDEERVPLRVDLLSAMCLERGAQDSAVVGEHLPVLVSQLLDQPGRALDVREEERDCAARELRHLVQGGDYAVSPGLSSKVDAGWRR